MSKTSIIVFLLIIPIVILGVDLSKYFDMIEKGQTEEVRKALPELQREYPDNAEVLYLSGVVEDDGNKALLIFKDVVSKYPNSIRADDALYQIIQYIYTSGLYHKAIKYSKGLVRRYPESQLINETLGILLCSFSAMQKKDSVEFYYHQYKEKYPDLNFNFKAGKFNSTYIVREEGSAMPVSRTPASPATEDKTPETTRDQQSSRSGPFYSIQLGAFGNPSNAYLLKNRLQDKGYEAYTKKVGKERQLLAVRVGKFDSRTAAKNFGEEFKAREELDYIVVQNK